ncbi:MAG: DUF4145 domain-containing protein [Deltaproteobacteria bacterium]|nr:DUF4145 domain-containing protein [Deltaproteobacteria bacterium]
MDEYLPPKFNLDAFHCPHCGTYAKQDWYKIELRRGNILSSNIVDPHGKFDGSHCTRCQGLAIWVEERMIFPITSGAPIPNPDLPADIKSDYNEANQIANLSPRAAGALLRLAIQKMCKHLGEPGKNINDDIKSLVSKGLPVKVQQALDSVRVIGNNCVHPGQLDVSDNPDTVTQLFKLLNFIAYKTITEPNEIDEIYNALPQSQRDAIERRDKS